jgi:hypothetical protein
VCRLDLTGSGQGEMEGSCNQEPLGSVKYRHYLERLSSMEFIWLRNNARNNPDYTDRNCKVQTNFGHEISTPKQKTMSVSTCVLKHLICELQLKEYNHNKCSKCPP